MSLERIITILSDESSLSKNLSAPSKINQTEARPYQSVYQHVIPTNSHRPPISDRGVQANTMPTRPKLGFFNLPTEIRLQIYETVNELNPVLPRQLDPGYPDYHPKPYFAEPVVRAITRDDDDEDADWTWIDHEELGLVSTVPERKKEDRPTVQVRHQPLLSPHRPRGFIPHALLRTCRRLYKEARCIPFYENEFVFATWFSTGSSSALAFISGLKAWQWAAMSYVRLEIPLRDIDGTDKLHLANWGALCEKWAFGLRGMRLTIVYMANVMGGVGDYWEGKGGSSSSLVDVCPGVDVGDLKVSYPWIDAGLRKLEALRRLEVELKTTVLSDDQKLDWCEGLKGRMAGRGGGAEDVDVVCVRGR